MKPGTLSGPHLLGLGVTQQIPNYSATFACMNSFAFTWGGGGGGRAVCTHPSDFSTSPRLSVLAQDLTINAEFTVDFTHRAFRKVFLLCDVSAQAEFHL